MGMVPDIGLKTETYSQRIGLKLQVPKVVGKFARHKSLKEKSLAVEGAKLFNSLPRYLREFTGTYETFKANLDELLNEIPDTPSIGKLKSYCLNKDMKSSNSIRDWLRVLQKSNWIPASAIKDLSSEIEESPEKNSSEKLPETTVLTRKEEVIEPEKRRYRI